ERMPIMAMTTRSSMRVKPRFIGLTIARKEESPAKAGDSSFLNDYLANSDTPWARVSLNFGIACRIDTPELIPCRTVYRYLYGVGCATTTAEIGVATSGVLCAIESIRNSWVGGEHTCSAERGNCTVCVVTSATIVDLGLSLDGREIRLHS